MARRNVQLDHNGRRRNPLSDAGRLYLYVRVAAPVMPHQTAAYVSHRLGNDLMFMEANELRAAIIAASEEWDRLTNDDKAEWARRAVKWESNPEMVAQMGLANTKAIARAALSLDGVLSELARLAFSDPRAVMSWGPGGVMLKDSDGLDADTAAMVAEVAEVLGKDGVRGVRVKLHSKTEALAALLRHFAPEKPSLALTQNNLNIRILVADADGNALKAG